MNVPAGLDGLGRLTEPDFERPDLNHIVVLEFVNLDRRPVDDRPEHRTQILDFE